MAKANVPTTVPTRYEQCRELAQLPPSRGGWTKAQVIKALGAVRASEIEKADCLQDLQDWTEGQLRNVRGTN